MPVNNILSEDAVEAHSEILNPENYRSKELFEELIDRICKSVTLSTINGILYPDLTSTLVESFDGYEGILEDVRLSMVNLWLQARMESELPTILVCDKYVPAVCPFYNADMPYMLKSGFAPPFLPHYPDRWFDRTYHHWIRNLKEKEEFVEMASTKDAIRSMRERLQDHIKTRLSHYYNTRNHLEAIGTPYSSTKLRVKFKTPTKGARVMYTPIYNYSPQYTNGFTSPATAYMDPGTYELRISPATGSQKKEPNPHGIHQSQTINMTV